MFVNITKMLKIVGLAELPPKTEQDFFITAEIRNKQTLKYFDGISIFL